MGRPEQNSGPSSQGGRQQPQEYHHFQPPTQRPETIDDAPPPFESSNDENQQEYYEVHKPPQKKVENPPQFPSQKTQMRAPPSGHDNQPQAFPPSSDHHEVPPHAFPPSKDHDEVPPQAFPPSKDHDEVPPQAFPPPQSEVHAFPPPQSEVHAHAFPPPQSDQVHAFPPPAPGTFQHQNMHHFQQSPHFQTTGLGGGQIPINPGMQNSPLVHANAHQVINNNPLTGFPIAQTLPTNPWTTELFGCMDDPTNALVTACFPCVTFGQIAEIVDSGQTSCATSGMLYGCIACFLGVPCIYSCTYRTKLRSRYGLVESPAPDWIIHCFCEWCALCQEYRELHKRGIDPSIGWQGNLARSQQMVQQQAAMTPPMRQNMMMG